MTARYEEKWRQPAVWKVRRAHKSCERDLHCASSDDASGCCPTRFNGDHPDSAAVLIRLHGFAESYSDADAGASDLEVCVFACWRCAAMTHAEVQYADQFCSEWCTHPISMQVMDSTIEHKRWLTFNVPDIEGRNPFATSNRQEIVLSI